MTSLIPLTLTTEEFTTLSHAAQMEFITANTRRTQIAVPCQGIRRGQYTISEKTRCAIDTVPGTFSCHIDPFDQIHVTLDVNTQDHHWKSIDFTNGNIQDHINQIKAIIANRFVELNIINRPHEFNFYFNYNIAFNQQMHSELIFQ
jgi:hypothetical protein